MSDDVRFVVRVPKELAGAVDDVAGDADLTRSQWMRQVMEAAITWDWIGRNRAVLVQEDARVKVNGEHRLGMSIRMPEGRCLHPPTARETVGTVVNCGMCGTVIRRLI